MHIVKVALLGLALSIRPAPADDWIDTGTELMRIVRDGQTVCRLWIVVPGESLGFSMHDAGRSTVTYELIALRVGSIYSTTDPDLVVLRGTCDIPSGFAIRADPAPWATPP